MTSKECLTIGLTLAYSNHINLKNKNSDFINFYATERHLNNAEVLSSYSLYGLEDRFHAALSANRCQTKNWISQPEKNISEDFQIASMISDDIETASENLHQTDYFLKRGVSYNTAEKCNCGYIEKWIHPKNRKDPKVPPSPRAIIPTSDRSYIARSTDYNTVSKIKAGSSSIFNINLLKTSSQHVVIVEGEFDALSVIEAGNDAVALGSVNNVHE